MVVKLINVKVMNFMGDKFYKISIIGFIISISIGLFLRFQFAGLVNSFEQFDLRRVHTHIGFYLFLFPMVWQTFKLKSWSPRSGCFSSYLLVSVLALLSFLFFGYGTLSKILSGVVLFYWLAYAVINLKKKLVPHEWRHPYHGIILATISIGFIVFFGVKGEAELSVKIVRAFMTCLVWGVFVPFALEKKGYFKVKALWWGLCVVLTAVFVTGVFETYPVFLGPIGLGTLLFQSLYKTSKREGLRLDLYWFVASLSLSLFGFGVIENQSYIAVGGLHFIILGPILQSIFELQKEKFLWVYDVSLMIMVVSISAPVWVPQHYKTTQLTAALASSVLVSWLFVFIFKVYKQSIRRR